MADEHGERTKTVVVGVDETVEGANRRRGCARAGHMLGLQPFAQRWFLTWPPRQYTTLTLTCCCARISRK